ncbi:MAG: 2-amino-4-hydroxy-6-hydroxymethyldihydropteridine diphosphokinase, partial [Selenomonas sp.]|nr:2-amino-4-hydroxy-6-hydroxymethyldihydropteridine diphosphokinase [Selenomonas sp.]
MSKVYLSLGANLGHRGESIREALRRLALTEGVKLLQVAPFYETAPWGKTDQPGFINT